jgi:hypothetical protein
MQPTIMYAVHMTIEGAPFLKDEHLPVLTALINAVRKAKDIFMLTVISV